MFGCIGKKWEENYKKNGIFSCRAPHLAKKVIRCGIVETGESGKPAPIRLLYLLLWMLRSGIIIINLILKFINVFNFDTTQGTEI